MKKQLLILLVVGLGGCSVKRDTVANNPPRIPSPSEQKFTSEA